MTKMICPDCRAILVTVPGSDIIRTRCPRCGREDLLLSVVGAVLDD